MSKEKVYIQLLKDDITEIEKEYIKACTSVISQIAGSDNLIKKRKYVNGVPIEITLTDNDEIAEMAVQIVNHIFIEAGFAIGHIENKED